MPAELEGRFSRVLVVEDDELLRRSITRSAARLGSSISSAGTVAQALSLLGPGFDLVISDVRLPDGTAHFIFQLAARLQTRPLLIAISGCASAGEAFDLAMIGVDSFLSKPFTRLQLESCIQECLARRAGSVIRPRTYFRLDSQGLDTPSGAVILCRPSLTLLLFLLTRQKRFATSEELARELLGRRDLAGQALVRRRVADTRRALGCHAWIVESVPKRGYRIDPKALALLEASPL